MSPRVRHRLHVCVVSLLLTAFVSLALGMTFEFVGGALDARRFPRVGQSFNVNAHNWNLDCSGGGPGPVVILESGLGVPAYGWLKVQPGIAAFAPVCSYDRAGYGWSDHHSTPRDSRTIAQELHALLAAAHVRPPYILVGHSFGGFNIRVFNGLYRDEVAGLVFVDSSHEDQTSRMPPELKAKGDAYAQLALFIPPALNIGLVRAARAFTNLPFVPPSVIGEPRARLEYLTMQPKMFRAAAEEMRLFSTLSAQQVRDSGNAGDKPLIVLTAGRDSGAGPEFRRIWIDELQPSLARLSTRGKRVLVEDSTHMIPYERPDAIVDAVREILRSL